MNFRQIKMLNDLEAKVAALDIVLDAQQALNHKLHDAFIEVDDRLKKLENPPKRRPGRPRKIVNNGN